MQRGLDWLISRQEADGSWFGRWGTNYIYGTWSVLCALNACGLPHDAPTITRAAQFLLDTQREDGGWGEDEETYRDAPAGRFDRSTPSQTAWALLGLMAAGCSEHPAVARGVAYLAQTQGEDGQWSEDAYTAVGFPRVFYLRYHGYRQFFPLMAVSRYVALSRRNDRRVAFGF
jgi:squalene-hopene/tetraprenyl-beta-curcumene cyclase